MYDEEDEEVHTAISKLEIVRTDKELLGKLKIKKEKMSIAQLQQYLVDKAKADNENKAKQTKLAVSSLKLRCPAAAGSGRAMGARGGAGSPGNLDPRNAAVPVPSTTLSMSLQIKGSSQIGRNLLQPHWGF